MVPVREDGIAGPDGADVEAAVGVFEEEVVCGAAIVGWIAGVVSVLHYGEGRREAYASDALSGLGM